MAALLDGEEFSVTELTEIAFDEAFPPVTFLFKPPPGVEVLPPETVDIAGTRSRRPPSWLRTSAFLAAAAGGGSRTSAER